MGVQLNIKDTETVELARNLAEALGKSVTSTIREALEEKAQRRAEARAAEIAENLAAVREISASFRANMPAEWHGKTSKEIMDEIYDEDGLPK